MQNSIGDTVIFTTVIFTDEVRVDHNALVTDVHGDHCINLVYVTSDKTKYDSYGRQIERKSSVTRYGVYNHFGNCFREIGVEATFDEPVRP
jgi:hypothetical protein